MKVWKKDQGGLQQEGAARFSDQGDLIGPLRDLGEGFRSGLDLVPLSTVVTSGIFSGFLNLFAVSDCLIMKSSGNKFEVKKFDGKGSFTM